jgi:RNA polymerase sigma-70 factor, ECF subfamily
MLTQRSELDRLVTRARRGDADAFVEAMSLVHARISGIASGICSESELARDAVQTTYSKAFASIRNLRTTAAFVTWVDRIAVRTSIDVVRKSRAFEPLTEVEAWTRDDVLEAMTVRTALLSLPVEQRAAVVLYYWLDQPVVTIAAALGCEPGTVKSRLARARETLATILKEDALNV